MKHISLIMPPSNQENERTSVNVKLWGKPGMDYLYIKSGRGGRGEGGGGGQQKYSIVA